MGVGSGPEAMRTTPCAGWKLFPSVILSGHAAPVKWASKKRFPRRSLGMLPLYCSMLPNEPQQLWVPGRRSEVGTRMGFRKPVSNNLLNYNKTNYREELMKRWFIEGCQRGGKAIVNSSNCWSKLLFSGLPLLMKHSLWIKSGNQETEGLLLTDSHRS